MIHPYASLADRTRAGLIDGTVWFSWFMSLIFIPWPESIPGQLRFALWILPPLMAEPLEVFFRRASIGQSILGLRVEARPGHAFPSLLELYLRHFSKFFLGGLSFAFIPFAPRNEAIHDRLFKTVVVKGGNPQPIDPIRPDRGSVRRMFAVAGWMIAGSIVGSIALTLIAALIVPGFLDAREGEMRSVEAVITILLGVVEGWILFRGVRGKLPGLRTRVRPPHYATRPVNPLAPGAER